MFSVDLVNPDDPTYGLWRVSSEGDSASHPEGIYLGCISDIATKLGQRGYCLNFERLNPTKIPPPKHTHNSVLVCVSDYLYSGKDGDEVQYWVEQFKKSDPNGEKYCVAAGNVYHSIRLEFSENTKANLKRSRALSKLTQEERELLGL